MTPENPLLQPIFDYPEDDDLRLVCADWLEDHGEFDRAEFIRVQITLAQLPPEDPRRAALEEREQQLLKEHRQEWIPQPVGEVSYDCTFRRGFVEHIGIDARTFLEHADRLFRWPLLRRVAFGCSAEPCLAALAACPYLARLAELDLRGYDSKYTFCIFNEPGAARLFLSSPNLARLQALRLGYCQNPLEVAQIVAESIHLRRLTTLEISDTALGDEGVQVLAGSSNLAGLTRLRLSRCEIGSAGMQELAASPRLSRLGLLDLQCTDVGDAGVQALAASPYLANLAHLSLEANRIGAAGAEALAAAPHLARLTSLDLSSNPLTPRGAQALVDSAHLPNLATLRLPTPHWLGLPE
jgi:uncharacterized protein (TIGR02996 family)